MTSDSHDPDADPHGDDTPLPEHVELHPWTSVFDAPGWPQVDKEIGDLAFLLSVRDVEMVVAYMQAELGIIPPDPGMRVADALHHSGVAPQAAVTSMHASVTPIPGIVEALREEVGPELAPWVHYGLTSQDCIDTAISLMQGEALDICLAALSEIVGKLAAFARETKQMPILARTVATPAAPTTLGYRAIGWLQGAEAAYAALLQTRGELAVQLGGAVGDLGKQGDHAVQLVGMVAEQLQLAAPRTPWHTERSRILRAATSYVQAINACAKFAGDLMLMVEFGEARLGGDPQQQHRGRSSAMKDKRNPAAAVLISIAARQAPGLLATVAASGVQEMERAAGAWQAEWRPLRELVRLLGGALRETLLLLNDMGIDQQRMRDNLLAAEVGDDVSAAVRRTDEYLARFEED
ncbi:hypothetical protein EK0264_11280 [Epidermidibacterium keratini]|uniref:Fumarate lyase N-terminal domain-containing protein n=1 Tax=Epidermidibacterium keratini TaxID=1891644 RepID=A0A7L4YNS5_9ACTN|nr:lyase family protein [Epidermidibacterium keratini]QHC00810.1 hypothetical protein EK0264_11280 [Epidermidibacterium keratini]